MVEETAPALLVLGMGEGMEGGGVGSTGQPRQPVMSPGTLEHDCIQAWPKCEMGRLAEPQLPRETQDIDMGARTGTGTETWNSFVVRREEASVLPGELGRELDSVSEALAWTRALECPLPTEASVPESVNGAFAMTTGFSPRSRGELLKVHEPL